MGKCYKKPFIKKVIARINFTSKIEIPSKGLNKKNAEIILRAFPIPEPKKIITKQVQLSNNGAKEISDTQNHLIYHSNDRDKTLCIAPEYAYVEILKYSTYNNLKNDFELLLDVLDNQIDFSVERFGLRFINQIEIDENDPLNWSPYINDDLLASFNIVKNKKEISRVFSNIIQKYDDGLNLNFQYGMHNPDYPSRIKNKMFILDFDAFIQGVMEKDFIKEIFEKAHCKIENLFETSIKENLREKMKELYD